MYRSQKKDLPISDRETYEGEYTTWIYIHTNAWAFLWNGTPARVDNYGTYYVYDAGGNITYIRDRNNTVLDVAAWEMSLGTNLGDRYTSINNKYVLLGQFTASPIFRVYRKGVLYFARSSALDIVTVTDVVKFYMSPNGKYILLNTNGGVSRRVMLYEGA